MKFKRNSVIGLLVAMAIVFAGIGFAYAQTAADADFDGDGIVGVKDFLLFVARFGTNQGDGKYEAKYDLDGDRAIGVSDFLVFIEFFGQSTVPNEAPKGSFALTGGASLKMMWIEPGTFQMGQHQVGQHDLVVWPLHAVTISEGFYLGKYEVTQEQWESVMGTRPWQGQDYVRSGSDYPAVYVSWEDTQEFIRRLNESEGSNVYRLPTEAEWEYACRAGTTTRWSFGDDESQLRHYAWYYDNAWGVGERDAQIVGTKRANPWGLYDMHGNVIEWVQDWYDGNYYSVSPSVDPQGPSSGSNRVLRGGNFGSDARSLRSATRGNNSPSYRDFYVGFRILREGP